jgi:2-methylaconitate cis-trans-isomerase PrpF
MKVNCTLMRGGTSRGPFFLASDLPQDVAARDAFLLRAMGSGHALQVDGLGGGNSLTSKVAIVSKSTTADVDYLFAQVSVLEQIVDTSPNCGNMLSAVAPFAIEQGLVKATHPRTKVLIRNINTNSLVESEVETPNGMINYEGNTSIDGVNGSAAPIILKFLDAAGGKTGALLPSQKSFEEINGIKVTLIDYAMPMMLVKAEDLGLRGNETPSEIDDNLPLFEKLEAMRRIAGERMGLGDVSKKVIPKIGILSNSKENTLTSRYLVPDKCHKAHAVTGALCIAAAVVLPQSVAHNVANTPKDNLITIAHPSGKIDVIIELNAQNQLASASLVRTARKIFEGVLYA